MTEADFPEGDLGGKISSGRGQNFGGVMISQSRKFCDDHRRFRRSQADPSHRNTTALRSLQAADACSPRCYGGTAATDVSYDMPCVVPRISRSWIFSVCKRVTRSTATTTTGSLHVVPVYTSIAHLRHCLYSACCRCVKRQPRQAVCRLEVRIVSVHGLCAAR